jgi:hypothetical protein
VRGEEAATSDALAKSGGVELRGRARADMRNVERCVHRLRLLMYGRSEVRCCARVVVMMSSEEVRCAVVSGDAPGPRLEGRKEGTPAFPAHVPHAKPGAGVHSSSLEQAEAHAHADHNQDSTRHTWIT